MSGWALLGFFGLAAGAVSGAIGVTLAYFEFVRWWRLRRGRRRLLAIAAREREAAARLAELPHGRRVVSALSVERSHRRPGHEEGRMGWRH